MPPPPPLQYRIRGHLCLFPVTGHPLFRENWHTLSQLLPHNSHPFPVNPLNQDPYAIVTPFPFFSLRAREIKCVFYNIALGCPYALPQIYTIIRNLSPPPPPITLEAIKGSGNMYTYNSYPHIFLNISGSF